MKLLKIALITIMPHLLFAQQEDPWNYVTPVYGVSTAAISVLNLSLNITNGVQMDRKEGHNGVPVLGILSGIGQITIGAFNLPEEQQIFDQSYINQRQKNVSIFNIGFGSVTVLLSTINLVVNSNKPKKSVSWNVYSFPTEGNNMGLGFSVRKMF